MGLLATGRRQRGAWLEPIDSEWWCIQKHPLGYWGNRAVSILPLVTQAGLWYVILICLLIQHHRHKYSDSIKMAQLQTQQGSEIWDEVTFQLSGRAQRTSVPDDHWQHAEVKWFNSMGAHSLADKKKPWSHSVCDEKTKTSFNSCLFILKSSRV